MDFNLPETAKALSAPVTKLIEVIAAGCGRAYEPTGIRRNALAQGDALVIMEEAKARANEVSVRAAQRLLAVEERRQENIESIAVEAQKRLSPQVSTDPVDPDWVARFFSECQDVGNVEMQAVWGRLLADEVARPGSFSKRTLSIVKNLEPEEAQNFNLLCRSTFHGIREDQFFAFVGVPESSFWDSLGLNFPALQRLDQAGLIVHHSLGLHLSKATQVLLRGPRTSLLVESKEAASLPFGKVSFTRSGIELAKVCEWDIPDARLEEVKATISSSFQVQTVTAIDDGEGVRVFPA